MKILMIHQHYYPEMSGTARRTKELAEQFSKQGHKVSVITSFPREYRSMPGEVSKSFEVINNVSIFRVKTIFEVKNNVFLRMLSYLGFVFKSIRVALILSKKSDLIISIAPLSSGIIGSIVNIIRKKHHHFDVPDILPDLGISAGMIRNKYLIYLLYKLEKWVYDHSNSISAITDGQIANIVEKGVKKEKLHYIPDWIDDSFFRKNLELHKNFVKAKMNYRKKIIISFVGNIGALQNPEIFLHVMKSLSDDNYYDFQFLFIGDGIMLPELKYKAKTLDLGNVEFVGRVKRELIPGYMKLSDILVANYLPNDYMNICIPGKLFEYAISKKPIIMGATGEAKKFIIKYKLGLVAKPSDIEDFKNLILKISNSSYKFKPETDRFVNDFSLKTISKLYQPVFNLVN